MQTALDAPRLVVEPMHERGKIGPTEPDQGNSTNTDPNETALDQKRLERKYDIELQQWLDRKETFEDSWETVYAILYSQYCSRDIQARLQEEPTFKTNIRNNPLELLIRVESLMYVPMKAAYLILTLIETLTSLLTIKQHEKEGC